VLLLKLKLKGRLFLGAPLLMAVGVPMGVGQGSALPSFDVATVRLSSPTNQTIGFPSLSAGRFTASNVTVESLIGFAYDIPWSLNSSRVLFNPRSPNLLGGPGWVSSDRYDIAAKGDDSLAEGWNKLSPKQQKEELREMVKSLLADRFKLQMRHETREIPVYALVVAKSGSKLTPTTPEPVVAVDPNAPPAPYTYKSPWKLNVGLIGGHGVTMSDLATMLWTEREIGSRKVLDKTGLEGKYDFTLKWASEDQAASTDSSGPSIFTAIQEQLGLRLESTKAPLDVLVIDHIERPSEN
jgi:uncharacterized protein (TIGR03435 family)